MLLSHHGSTCISEITTISQRSFWRLNVTFWIKWHTYNGDINDISVALVSFEWHFLATVAHTVTEILTSSQWLLSYFNVIFELQSHMHDEDTTDISLAGVGLMVPGAMRLAQ